MYKKKCLTFFIISIISFISLAGGYTLYAYKQDPLHLFHKINGTKVALHQDMRFAAAGIIRNYDFDSIILGNSRLENQKASLCNTIFGGKFVNLSVSGGKFQERMPILKYALKKKKLKKVILSIDPYYINCETNSDYSSDNWLYLYGDDTYKDFSIYYKKNFVAAIMRRSFTIRDLDRPNAWLNNKYHSVRFGGIKNWVDNLDKQGMEEYIIRTLPKQAEQSINKSYILKYSEDKNFMVLKYLDNNICKFLANNPDTEFYLVFPPLSRIYWADLRQNKPIDFSAHQAAVRHMVKFSSMHDNIRIFGFEDMSFLDDISKYKDISHYDNDTNEFMVQEMAKGKQELTLDNVEDYLRKCDDLAYDFDFVKLNKEAQRLLQSIKK